MNILRSRITRAPENDDGFELETVDEVEETDDLEGEVDADEGDEDEAAEVAAGAADGDGQETSGRQEEVRAPSRAERRIQQALREAKEAKEEAQRLRAELSAPRPQPTETPAQREERLAQMDPEQRLTYELGEVRNETRNELARMRFESADASDRTSFEGLCSRQPVAAKLRGEVEDRLSEMRRAGTNAPRETVLKFLIGDRALSNASRANGKATRRAAENTARQTSRPASPRGDTAGERTRGSVSEAEARRKRLEDMQI